ncbi:MAG: hypothetical protein J0I49_09795 [Pseudonocardia sp.]|uniref:hypothetical protein n=1 Tax=Pseudonocardia sp. TaxID=60912 RepID=UPI001AC32090|nr:hypothetical protein [Pseudonocardia sp.]MBN9098385.1 hypothetical protein [Pseudonocardia sp.]
MNPQPDAAWTVRLTAPVDEATTRQVLRDRRWEHSFGTARSWSIDHAERGLRELDAAARGLESDRMAELLECVEAVSEHFGIAVAAGNEMALWQHLYGTPPPLRSERRHVELARQALGSLCGHHLLCTGHGVAAVALPGPRAGPAPAHDRPLRHRLPAGSRGPQPATGADGGPVPRPRAGRPALAVAVTARPGRAGLDGGRPTGLDRAPRPQPPPDAPGVPAGSAWVEGPGYRAYAWDRAGADRAPADLLVQVERLLAAKLPDIRAQIDLVIADVVP